MAIHPSSIENGFGGHYVFWALFLPLMTLIFIPFFFPDQRIDPAELAMVQTLNVDVDQLTAAANKTFSGLFIDTGVMGKSESYFGGGPSGTNPAVKMGADWLHGIWMMLYKAIWRMQVLVKVFFLPLIALVIPAAIDGLVVRARKRYTFETSNPIFFYSSMHIVVLMVGLFTFLPLAPISLTSTTLFLLLAGLGFGIWIAASNFQTGS